MKAKQHLDYEITQVKKRIDELEFEIKYAQGYLAGLNYCRVVLSDISIMPERFSSTSVPSSAIMPDRFNSVSEPQS